MWVGGVRLEKYRICVVGTKVRYYEITAKSVKDANKRARDRFKSDFYLHWDCITAEVPEVESEGLDRDADGVADRFVEKLKSGGFTQEEE